METLNKLKSTLHGKSYAEKYDIWMKILQTVDSFESHLKCELYSEFLQEYPFVYDQWNTLAQIYAKQKEPHRAFEIYEWGLGLNKRGLKLWQCFCAWVEETYRENKDLVRDTYNKAIIAVGLDFYSSSIWDRYLRFEELDQNLENQNTLYWRMVSVPHDTVSNLPLRFKNFIERIDDLEIVRGFAEKLNLPVQIDPEFSSQTALVTYRKYLSAYYEDLAKQTIEVANSKIVFEGKLKQTLYEGKAHDVNERNSWLNYINYQKKISANQPPFIMYVIEKATTYLCTSPEIWRELVDYLENTIGDRQYLLGSLHNYRKMLRNIDITLVFLEADLTELLGDLDEARNIYTELDAFRPKNVEISVRRSQFEMRQGRHNDATAIMESLLFKSNLKIHSKVYILQEYLTILRRSAQKDACLKLLDSALKELPFSRLIYSIYCDYIIENLPYVEVVRKIVRAFEGALPRAKKTGDTEFNLTLHLYQSTIRSVCRSMNLIFKIEKNLSLRFKEPRIEGDEFDARAKELAQELDLEILKATTEEELQQGLSDVLGKRDPEFENPDSDPVESPTKAVKGN